jgi:hypothetical protein
MADITLNKSFLYFLPIVYRELVKDLQIPYKYFADKLLFVTVLNTYVYVNQLEFFCIRFENTDISEEIIELLSKSTLFVGVEREGGGFAIIMKIPVECQDCYKKFTTGKYSKILDVDKKEIIKFADAFLSSQGTLGVKLVESIQQVLEKAPERKEMIKKMYGLRDFEYNDDWEVSSIIDVDKETYNYG